MHWLSLHFRAFSIKVIHMELELQKFETFNGAYANFWDPGDTYTIQKVLLRCMTHVDGRPQCHSLAEIWEGEVSGTAEDRGDREIRTWRGAHSEFSSSREFEYSISAQSGVRVE